MNIYISKHNEDRLRSYQGSMSGLINDLLYQYFSVGEKQYNRNPHQGDEHMRTYDSLSSNMYINNPDNLRNKIREVLIDGVSIDSEPGMEDTADDIVNLINADKMPDDPTYTDVEPTA